MAETRESGTSPNRAPYADQNVVVAFYGEDGSYFVGRETAEQAADTVSQLERLDHKILEVTDCSDDPSMAGIIADDLRSTYATNYQAPEQYRI